MYPPAAARNPAALDAEALRSRGPLLGETALQTLLDFLKEEPKYEAIGCLSAGGEA